MPVARKRGTVYLVGAGPGDPGLLTMRGAKLVESADVILYDGLVSPHILDLAKVGARKIYVGKAGTDLARRSPDRARKSSVGTPSGKKQTRINALMARQARAGREVVRLKGGDPLVFGRGGEEAEYLASRGIPVEVVPGVTAAFGAFATLMIPVTHRDCVSQLALVAGHEDPRKKMPGLNYKNLAHFEGTLVFYMGMGGIRQICEALIRNGKNPNTPCLVVRYATTPLEEIVRGTLKDIAGKVRARRLEPPGLILVGEVVRHALATAAKSSRPLFGKKILITRSHQQARALRGRLEDLGAEVISLPAIKFAPPSWRPVDQAIRALENKAFDWVVFTSQNGVEFFSRRLGEKSKDWRSLGAVKVACIGEATAERLGEKGLRADLVPKEFVAEALFRALKKKTKLRGARFLLLRGDLARPWLKNALCKAGARVREVVVYRTRRETAPSSSVIRKIQSGGIDFIPFASSSSVRNFFAQAGSSWLDGKTKIISIGPITSRTLKKHGLKVHGEAKRFTAEGLIEAILKRS